jgi:GR25 family glycosyltransferase involved in LPS biosynthesis
VKLDIIYINLESATQRNEEFIKNFNECGFTDEWRIHRFNAVSGKSEVVENTPGRISPNLKGAHHSHIESVKLSRQFDNHVLIAEDDTQFCHETQFWLEHIVNSIPESDWDVILTDFYVANAIDMPDLMKARRQCMEKRSINLTNAALWKGAFAGAGSYVINKNSKDKFLQVMDFDSLDNAYDLLLRQAMCTRELNGVLTFPFLSTVSEVGDESQNQMDDRVLEMIYMHLFRRMSWIGADSFSTIKERADHLRPQDFPDDVAALEAVMMPLLSLQMHWRT